MHRSVLMDRYLPPMHYMIPAKKPDETSSNGRRQLLLADAVQELGQGKATYFRFALLAHACF